jgi:hypothetical protein
MNEQLALIDKKTIPARRHLVRKEAVVTTSTRYAKDQWWKLSEEQRQQGLAGVRSIRAILDKTPVNDQLDLAKAS